MKTKEKQEIINYVQAFFKDNEGNKNNQWLYAAFMGSFLPILDKIETADTQELLNIQSKIGESK